VRIRAPSPIQQIVSAIQRGEAATGSAAAAPGSRRRTLDYLLNTHGCLIS
jgi:hypothetical protein